MPINLNLSLHFTPQHFVVLKSYLIPAIFSEAKSNLSGVNWPRETIGDHWQSKSSKLPLFYLISMQSWFAILYNTTHMIDMNIELLSRRSPQMISGTVLKSNAYILSTTNVSRAVLGYINEAILEFFFFLAISSLLTPR